jgi:DNA-directed RNA polymerase subunit RPC12/RpoP
MANFAELYCNSCHNITRLPQMKGNGWIELVLYLCYFIPGVIYSIWRRSGEPNVCPLCKAAGLIPASAAKPNASDELNGQPHCSELLPVDNAEKSNASAELRDEIECPSCAEKILAKAKICKHCGGDVNTNARKA